MSMETAPTSSIAAATATVPPSGQPLALDGILLLEQPFARSPYDELRRQLRSQQRLFEREFHFCHSTLSASGAQPSAVIKRSNDKDNANERDGAAGGVASTGDADGLFVDISTAKEAAAHAESESMEAIESSKSPKKKVKEGGSASPNVTISANGTRKRLIAASSLAAKDVVSAASEKLENAAVTADVSMDEDVSMSVYIASADVSMLEPPPSLSRASAAGSSGPSSSFGGSTPAAERDRELRPQDRGLAAHRALLSDPAQVKADAESAVQGIDTMLTRLRGLKRKLSPLSTQMSSTTKQAQARITHLQSLHSIPSTSSPAYENFARKRLDRVLSDFMLRKGYAQTSKALSQKRSSTSKIDDGVDFSMLVDNDIFQEIERIERTLVSPSKTVVPGEVNKSTCAAALAWCAENKAALKKIKSTLEFELRLQEFIELARLSTPESLQEAILYARRHLIPFCVQPVPPASPTSGTDASMTAAAIADAREDYELALSLQSAVFRAMGLLACRAGGWTYEDLYHEGRWLTLRETFRACALEIHSLPPMPTIHIALSAGLSTLKVPACYSHTKPQAAENGGKGKGDSNGSTAAAESVSRETEVFVPTFPPAAGVIVDEVEDSQRSAAATGAEADVGTASAHFPPGTSGVSALGVTAATNASSNRPLAAASTATASVSHAHMHTCSSQLNDGRNVNCPVCDTNGLGLLAKEVPWSHHANSTLICRIQGTVMNEDDPPLVLPNGRVYSTSALTHLAIKSGDETITCPATGSTFPFGSTRKLYIS
ncbi:hypothetical protein K437DRAFT_267483 [Tilletiaria anomala UBC 951]|uniref:CTLH domain-containing protein n=1 Tax=Tilletiaria anomala (strain ATCC 24038 / CBS 436.72 / UBC 951) TaxID=1037660 RepID=A0A066W5I8_TILAU|nr:uncharacterized protein K437DRAFT_267483 [Tilletiaria anomala UBC 951]KDN49232.1 hypothetical protein K437DRAFT_267483 [Tilletiaria anomala UBC 951]